MKQGGFFAVAQLFLGENREITCSFTGYRPEKLPWGTREDDPRCQRLKSRLDETVLALYGEGYRRFICGMARGADMYFCEAVLRLKKQYPDVTLEAALPHEAQASRWNEYERNRYFFLVSQCDIETMITREYTSDCMQRRNRYMVDKSNVLVAVFDGKLGGTMSTRAYAIKRGVRVIEIAPDGA